jgi:hypothetical protein
MDRCAGLQKYQDIITCSYVRSNARDRRPAAKSARRGPCGWLALNVSTLRNNYLTTKGIEIGISIEITTELCNPIVYADRVLIPDQAVTPPLEGTSTPVKATCDERRPEQELRKSREELRVIHDNHSINDARAGMDECINENYNPQWEVSATGVTKPKDRVLRDKTNVAHHGTPPKKNKGAGKPKDTLATGTSDSPRVRQDDLARIAWPCYRRRQTSSPSRKRPAGISKTAYDPLGAQTKRAAELRAAYADQRRKQPFELDPLRNLKGREEDADSI